MYVKLCLCCYGCVCLRYAGPHFERVMQRHSFPAYYFLYVCMYHVVSQKTLTFRTICNPELFFLICITYVVLFIQMPVTKIYVLV